MDYSKLSKEVAYALRHAPWEYGLELDAEGWVDINQLLSSLHECEKWKKVSEHDLHVMIEKSDKKRYEISNGKIRALYGHSIPQRIIKEQKCPPEVLYHGTARRFVKSIKEKGLQPQGLSADVETALQVGKRRDIKPVLLIVNALEAFESCRFQIMCFFLL